jgi:glycosyltransferase involved in cell wall biosynthesis
MKIGLTTFGGDGGKSGISQYIINLLQQFDDIRKEDQFEVAIYKDEREIFISDSSRLKPIEFSNRIRNPVANILWHQIILPGLCRKQGYDVLFLPAANRRAPIHTSCPTVGTVHDFSSIHVEGKYDAARMYYITRILPFLIRRLDHVITSSESSKYDILEYAHVPEDRITVIPLAANTDLYTPRDKIQAKATIGPKYGISRPFILYISRIEHPGKNHARLIHAFENMKRDEDIPHQLVLAGSDWDRADEVHLIAEQAVCKDDIIFTGFVDNKDIPILYNAADVFVFPSLYEGFGLPVLEAMSSGTPVACSNLSSIPEVAGDAGVLFDPYEIDSIKEALILLISDEVIRQDYARRGLDRSHLFNWRTTAEKTLQVIKNVVNV